MGIFGIAVTRSSNTWWSLFAFNGCNLSQPFCGDICALQAFMLGLFANEDTKLEP